jgi:class 3 adenylate cyclase
VLDALGADAQAATPSSGPVAERRLVSVLFADLVGFTGISDKRDPEQVRELLGRYFDIAREKIERYGGEVEKFIGDAVMAVWGTPVAHEDDAERAVRAALDVVDGVAALGAEMPELGTLRARAAVLTGEAAVTLGAIGQGMVAGDMVNTASRLQSVAEPGQVLVGEGTYQSASSAIVFEPVGEQLLRGKELAIPAWRAVRVVAGRAGSGRSQQVEPPFVGRDDDLRMLKDLLHATARDARARLVSVTGVAGIGKTRLAWELEKYVDGVVETIYWHQGRSPAYGEGVAFWALGEMVRQRAGLAETDGPEESRAKVREMLDEYAADADERDWMEPRLAALLGLEPTPQGEREELFAAWRRLFERISERGTVGLVFEEVHWADDGLLDFIESLLEWSRNSPIFVLTLARPELLERRPSWGAGQRSFTSVHLEPLDPDAMETLLVGLVPGIPPDLIRLVAERSEGIPLYAVELVRMLIDQGRIAETDGRYRLVADVPGGDLLAVPESLHALIGARLDGLEATERSLIQRAAVLGQSFTPDALAHLAEIPKDEVIGLLRQLSRKELLILESDPRSPERGQYRFVQSLIREVAYGRLAKRDRAVQHEAAAQYFESLGDAELAGVVASHYLQAQDAAKGTARADELASRAVRGLISAAERAAALYNHRQAFTFLNDAMGIEQDESARIDLMEWAAAAAQAADLREEAKELYGTLVDWHRSHANPAAQARAMSQYGAVLVISPEGPPAAVRYMEVARDELTSTTDESEMAVLEAELGLAYLMAGDFKNGAATIDKSLEVVERSEELSTIAELLASKGWAAAELGRTREGLAILRGTIPFAELHGFQNAYFRAAMNLSALGSLEDPREALTVALQAVERAERFGYNTWAGYLASNATHCQFIVGDWDECLLLWSHLDREEMDRSLKLNLASGAARVTAYREGARAAEALMLPESEAAGFTSPQDTAAFRETRSNVRFVERRFADAYSDAIAAADVDIAGSPVTGLSMAAHAALWLRDPQRLEATLARLDAARQHASVAAAVRLGLGAALEALQHRTDDSRATYAQAIARLDDVGARFEAVLARLERAVFLETSDDERQAFVADARTGLEGLGASALLGFLDEQAAAQSPAESVPEIVQRA